MNLGCYDSLKDGNFKRREGQPLKHIGRIGCFGVLILFNILAAARGGQAGAEFLLVLNKQEGSLMIVDGDSYKVLSTIRTGEGPHELTVSSDGRLAFVANYGTPQNPGRSISVIDVLAKRELRRVDVSPLGRPHGITESGGKIYFTTELTSTVARYDPVENRIDWIMGTGQAETHLLVVSPDQKKIFTANRGSNTVTAIEFLTTYPGATRITHIAVGGQPEGIDISPDGKELWVGHNLDGNISIIDASTDKVKQVMSASEMPIRVKFTRDGKRLAISDPKKGEFAIFDSATRKEIKRIKIGDFPVGVLMAPDNKRVFVAANQANKVVVINLEDLSIAGRIETGNGPDGLAWAKIR